MKTLLRIFSMSLFAMGILFGQYHGERVLEKSFEQADFFFVPNYVNPWGVKGFSTAAPGLINDPILNLQVNPAILFSDSLSKNYFYLDLRNRQEIVDLNPYGYYLLETHRLGVYTDIAIPYGRFYVSSRAEITPILSAAFLSRPLREKNPRLFVGFSYQVIFQDEKYYSIPQDIYKSVLGYDYSGARVAESQDITVIDRYSGTDNMHHVGHFGALHAGYDLDDNLQIGVRLARTAFERNGSFGSRNYWDNFSAERSSSVWYNMESRSQEYDHWDISTGINYRIDELNAGGIYLGILDGRANQVLSRLDTSLYIYGQPNVSTNWSYGRRYGTTDLEWNHDGKTYYGGLNYSSQLNASTKLNVLYRISDQDVQLSSTGEIIDSSNYSHRSQWQTEIYRSQSRYLLQDVRSGSGSRSGILHQFTAAFDWNVESNLNVKFGLSIESRSHETKTNEAVLGNRLSTYSSSSTSYAYDYYRSVGEDKTLEWKFKTSSFTVQIPFLFTWRISEKGEALLGINRRMIQWKTEEVTLARFKFKDETSQSTTSSKKNFIERYTFPTETVSTIETLFMGGFTVEPSRQLRIRVLVAPSSIERPYQDSEIDFQWWIGFSMYL